MMQEQARQNFAMFERALGMFNPYGKSENGPEGESRNDNEPEKAGGPKKKSDEIEILKAELAAMQDKLEKISKN